MAHWHFCLDALRWKVFGNDNHGGGNPSHLIAILVLQMRTKQINFHLDFRSGHPRPPGIRGTRFVQVCADFCKLNMND